MRTNAILSLTLLAVVLTGCAAWEARQAALDAANADVAGPPTGKTTGGGKIIAHRVDLGPDQHRRQGHDERWRATGSLRPRHGHYQRRAPHTVADEPNPVRRYLGPAGQHDDEQRLRASLHAASLEVDGTRRRWGERVSTRKCR